MDTLHPSGFKRFFESYYDRCFLFVKSYVHDDWVAEDISSEALIKLWEISKTQEIDNPKTLLFTIMKHKALDYLKHETVKQKTIDTLVEYGQRELELRISTLTACDPEIVFAADIQDIIRKTLESLPE
ncbi:MAG: sigma-70 family RNA polymerase sigma factor, partial [Tannerella sp.]|nr:sigma-70 family RNA polymerase sigma factor [Tannerella sp.]